MTEDEFVASLTPLERSQYDLARLQSEDALKAQRGELELPIFLERELEEQRAQQEGLLSQALGPQYYRSTPGIQQQQRIGESEAGIKEAFSRGERTAGLQLLSQNTPKFFP